MSPDEKLGHANPNPTLLSFATGRPVLTATPTQLAEVREKVTYRKERMKPNADGTLVVLPAPPDTGCRSCGDDLPPHRSGDCHACVIARFILVFDGGGK